MRGAGTALPAVAAIQRAVARERGIPVDWMRQPDGAGARRHDASHPRQEAMRLAVLMTEHSYTRIGQFFGGRDHSTVINACRSVDKRRHRNPDVHERLRRLTLDLLRKG